MNTDTISSQISAEIIDTLQLKGIDYNNLIFNGSLIDHSLPFPIDEIIAGVHGALGLIISKIWEMRTSKQQTVTIDIPHAYLSLSSVFLIRHNNYPIYTWDPVYPTVNLYQTKDDRYIFINGGHPNLRDRILKVLNVPNDKKILEQSIRTQWNALDLENALSEVNTCGAMVRTADEWLVHPHGKILSLQPLIRITKMCDMEPVQLSADPVRPLSGLRVLDLTSVVAGPMSGRVLAEHGADVLHIVAPQLPIIPTFAIETGNGKREAYLDLRIPNDLKKFKELLSKADIFIEGWRPDVMARYGLTPEEVQKINPGIIHITLSCYGEGGPFSQRAGWEQLAQAVSGIIASNYRYATEDGEESACGISSHHDGPKQKAPGNKKIISDTLTSHALLVCDYTTGIFGALGVLASLIKRSTDGGGYHVSVALSRSGMWLVSKSTQQPVQTNKISLHNLIELYNKHYCQTSHGPLGHLSFLSPVVKLSETNPYFASPSAPLGSSDPKWLERL